MTTTPHRDAAPPASPPTRARRVAAELLDLALVALPLAVGILVVDALGDAHGGGQADRLVFGTAAVLAAAAMLWWNRGLREGRTGRSLGKQWLGLVTRDSTGTGPVGARAALLRRGTETVTVETAVADGFAARPLDASLPAMRRRRLLGLAVLAALLVLALLASIAVGARPMSFAEVYHALAVNDGAETDLIVH